MSSVWRVFWGILQEISGQSAYQRHLKWHGIAHSPGAWREFCDERWAKEARRGRCC
jgi:hypothetical protein